MTRDLPAPDRVLLVLDAAPGVGSVALVGTGDPFGTVIAARAVAMRPASAAQRATPAADDDPLMRAVVDTLRDAQVRVAALAGIACGAGPGGFTSLRIAAAIAKGIAHASARPLLAGPSLAWAAAVRAPTSGTWLVTLDALRGEQYVAAVTLAAVTFAAGTRPDAASDAPRGHGAPGMRRVDAYRYLGVHPIAAVPALRGAHHAIGVLDVDGNLAAAPIAAGAAALAPIPVDLARWEPGYGRVAEAQARWEAAHGPMPAEPPLAVA